MVLRFRGGALVVVLKVGRGVAGVGGRGVVYLRYRDESVDYNLCEIEEEWLICRTERGAGAK